MDDLKNDYREGESFIQYVIDTLLLPIRIATSPALLRTYIRGVLLFITSTILLALAAVAYTSFYYSYIPVRGITAPLYLQFDHGSATRHTILQSHDVATKNWPYGIANIPGLVSRQKYDVVVEMTVPRSRRNLNAGNWMVGLEMRGPSTAAGGVKGMLGWDEEWNVEDHSQGGAPGTTTQKVDSAGLTSVPTVIARSRRPAILTYRSYVVEHVHRLLRLPLYLIGWHTESEHIEISMMESVEFDKGIRNVPTSVKIELRSSEPLEVYTVSVRFSARMEGLRWLMYRYWLTSAIIGTTLFWSVEMGVLLFTWAIFTLLFSSSAASDSQPGQKQIKQESGATTPKREETEPSTPFSETSRTFPSLPSHQALKYEAAPLPKSEHDSPALEDIPTREEAEADDEDDDFVLEEPLPRSGEKDDPVVDFVSLGMVILDDISIPNQEVITDVVGGSGAFSTTGYRLFNPEPRSKAVGCLVLAGSDFPAPVRKQLEEWDMSLVVKTSSDQLSTRGLLEYQDDTFGPKTFKYTTPPLKSSPIHLNDTSLLHARALHFFATAEELVMQVPELLKLRSDTEHPFIVWEPFPASCLPENRSAILEACKHVDLFSPNHLEFTALFDSNSTSAFDKAGLEDRAVEFAESTKTGMMVVRCGEHGSLTISRYNEPVWLPPYYAQGAKHVVDATGAGNAFLGGFTAGWMTTQKAKEASMYGSIASSFAIEQIGLPKLGSDGGEEVWNHVRVMDRLKEYKSNMKMGQIPSL